MRILGILAGLSLSVASQSAAADTLLEQVTEIWQSGAAEVQGQALPAPVQSNNSVMFDCGRCAFPFVALIQEDTLPDTFGTTDPDEVIALMRNCGDTECTLRESDFDGYRSVEYAYTVLETLAVTNRYFRDSGKDMILVVLRETEGATDDLPLVRAFEASYIGPLLALSDE